MAFNLLILVSEKKLKLRTRLHPQFLSLGYACWQIQLHWNEELRKSLHKFVQRHESNLHYLSSKTSNYSKPSLCRMPLETIHLMFQECAIRLKLWPGLLTQLSSLLVRSFRLVVVAGAPAEDSYVGSKMGTQSAKSEVISLWTTYGWI